MSGTLLEVDNISTVFHVDEGTIHALQDVSFSLSSGETLGLVGESGCGKSVTALTIMRLLPLSARVRRGQVLFEGKNLLQKSEREMRAIRGREISMIFQEPMTSLNPVYTIGDQVAESFMIHWRVHRREATAMAAEALAMVKIPAPRQRLKDYPHQLSGGMRQRVMIAMALACNPKVLIADEPTTALDVTIQAQILNLMTNLKEKLGTALILISHDLGVIAEMAQQVAVMYAGKIVEKGDVKTIFEQPQHPYTKGLLKSIPSIQGNPERLHIITGSVPHPLQMPEGCAFHPRCSLAQSVCIQESPYLEAVGAEHYVRCWYLAGEGA